MGSPPDPLRKLLRTPKRLRQLRGKLTVIAGNGNGWYRVVTVGSGGGFCGENILVTGHAKCGEESNMFFFNPSNTISNERDFSKRQRSSCVVSFECVVDWNN